MINELILGIAVILLTGLLFGKLAKKLKIPNVTGYLLGGLIIGPVLLKLVIPGASGILGVDLVKMLGIIVNIELAFIAFTIGCEFKLSYFKQVGPMPIIVAFAESFAAVVFVIGGLLLCQVPLYFALVMGALAGATAPAATIMVMRQYKAKGPFTKALMSIVAIDDVSALIYFGVCMAIAKSIISPGDSIGMAIAMPFIEIAGSCAFGLLTGILLTFLLRFFKSKSNRLVLTIALLFLNLGVFTLIEEKTGIAFSPLMACMLTGMCFSNTSKHVESVLPLVESITPPFVVIFFVVSGAGLEIAALTWTAALLVGAYLVFRVAGKWFGTYASSRLCKIEPKTSKLLGFGLLPQGGIAIGLSLIVMTALDGSKFADSTYNGQLVRVIVLCAVFISEIFGPILCKFALLKSGEGIAPIKRKKRGAALAAAGANGEIAATSIEDDEDD